MKSWLLAVMLLCFSASIAYAQYSQYGDTWGSDAWGHRTKEKNYWKDRDGDGVPNYYDRRDDNKYIW